MIRNGDVISGYTVLAVANGIVMAHSATAPDPFVVWHIDPPQRGGVSCGSYQQTIEDAEWEFCCKAFLWFEDNAPINMIEDEAAERIDSFNYQLDEAKERINACRSVLDEAQAAIDSAAALVVEMVVEHNRLEGKKEAHQTKTTNQVKFILKSITDKASNRHLSNSSLPISNPDLSSSSLNA